MSIENAVLFKQGMSTASQDGAQYMLVQRQKIDHPKTKRYGGKVMQSSTARKIVCEMHHTIDSKV